MAVYRLIRYIMDGSNALDLPIGTHVETECEAWVARFGNDLVKIDGDLTGTGFVVRKLENLVEDRPVPNRRPLVEKVSKESVPKRATIKTTRPKGSGDTMTETTKIEQSSQPAAASDVENAAETIQDAAAEGDQSAAVAVTEESAEVVTDPPAEKVETMTSDAIQGQDKS